MRIKSGNCESQNDCNFLGNDRKFKHLDWKSKNPFVSLSLSNVSFSSYVKFIPHPVDFKLQKSNEWQHLFTTLLR